MANVSQFSRVVESYPNAPAKLAALNVKLASLGQIQNRRPMVDPLDNPDIGPARPADGARTGGNIGAVAGALGGAALGGLAGHEFGAHMPLGDNITDAVGTGVGATAGAVGGGMAGQWAGKRLGAGISSLTASPEAEAANKIKQMDPASGLAHIRMMERSGHLPPSVIQSMKDAYNTRRAGLHDQFQAGVPVGQ